MSNLSSCLVKILDGLTHCKTVTNFKADYGHVLFAFMSVSVMIVSFETFFEITDILILDNAQISSP